MQKPFLDITYGFPVIVMRRGGPPKKKSTFDNREYYLKNRKKIAGTVREVFKGL
jgi:hypothetical protein